MTAITIHAGKPAGGFDETYPRAPFAELIRLTLVAADALGRLRRTEQGDAAAGRPAIAS